jgi:chromate transporter
VKAVSPIDETATSKINQTTTPPNGADTVSPLAGVRDVVPFRQAVRTWFAISLQTFGGPAGQIAVMQRTLVEEKRWIGQRRFLHALNYCMLLPGPEAQQLAIYVGWLLNGLRGGLVAGTLFVLPGVIALLALSAIYVGFGDTAAVTALFAGLAPAVLAIVAHAVHRVARSALHHSALVALAVAAFAALALFRVPFPLVVATAATVGWGLSRIAPHALRHPAHADPDGPAPLVADDALHAERPTIRRAVRILSVGLLLWAAPLLAVAVLTGTGSVFTTQGLFFSGTALVTFGGAYAVLAFVAQRAVEVYGWLTPGEMVRGLALAETTPGPLIMVVQFVAFLGAYRDPGAQPVGGRRSRGAAHHVGDVRAVLPVHLPRRSTRGAAAREPRPLSRPYRHHRCRRRRHRQPCALLCAAHAVRRHH